MEILDGNDEGLGRALGIVATNPNPAHLREDMAVNGRFRTIVAMLEDSMVASAFVAYSMREHEAMIGGVTLHPAEGLFRHQIWLLASAGSVRFPRWMVREGRRMLDAADRHLKWPHGYVQVIPRNYPQGIAYARHLGFQERHIESGPGGEIVVMERMIPRWVQ